MEENYSRLHVVFSDRIHCGSFVSVSGIEIFTQTCYVSWKIHIAGRLSMFDRAHRDSIRVNLPNFLFCQKQTTLDFCSSVSYNSHVMILKLVNERFSRFSLNHSTSFSDFHSII